MAQTKKTNQKKSKNSSNLIKWLLMFLVLFAIWYGSVGLFVFTVLMFYDTWNYGVWFYVSSLLYVFLFVWLVPFWVAYKMAPKYKMMVSICTVFIMSILPLYIIFMG